MPAPASSAKRTASEVAGAGPGVVLPPPAGPIPSHK